MTEERAITLEQFNEISDSDFPVKLSSEHHEPIMRMGETLKPVYYKEKIIAYIPSNDDLVRVYFAHPVEA